MKKLCSLFLGCLLLSACSNEVDEVIQEEPQSPKEYTVSLGLTGEIVDIEETPMSKAGLDNVDDLYGIQVYSKAENDANAPYTPYAYGLFTDVSALNIKLLAGYKYQFKATMVVDGPNKILGGFNSYSAPFYISAIISGENGDCPISTSFTYSTQNKMHWISNGYTSLKKANGSYLGGLNRPNTERFYGETIDYTPSENGQVKIDMGRTSYKVKIVVTGDKFTEGKVKVTMAESPDLYVIYEEDKNNDHSEEEIYTFYYVDRASKDKQYSEDVVTSFYWIKADNTEIPLKTNHTFTFKRNKQTTITIKVDDTQENGVGVEANDDEIVLGDSYTIENGDVTDSTVEVEPGK